MARLRIWLPLLLALALPIEGIATIVPQLACFGSGSSAPDSTSSATMPCHEGKAGDAAKSLPCCGDSCPDIAVCAASLALGVTSLGLPAAGRRLAPVDRYLLPELASRLSHPFRPPASSTL